MFLAVIAVLITTQTFGWENDVRWENDCEIQLQPQMNQLLEALSCGSLFPLSNKRKSPINDIKGNTTITAVILLLLTVIFWTASLGSEYEVWFPQ